MESIYKGARVLSVLMEVYTILVMTYVMLNVMVVLQRCTESLKVQPGSSSETYEYPTSSKGACDTSNMKVEKDIDIKEEKEVMDVKAEKGIGGEERRA
jgi:hypothetical protein